MDIRAYFGKKPSTTSKSLSKTSNTSKKTVSATKYVIDSDSDEDFVEEKRSKETVVKTRNKRRIIDSSDESENESPSKKLKNDTKTGSKRSKTFQLSDSSAEEKSPVKKPRAQQSKLSKVEVKSKFFKQTTAADMFGDEPIKRSNVKLKEISAKLKTKAKQTASSIPQIPDDDADFEATLAQLDEVGVDGWLSPSPRKESRRMNPDKQIAKTESSKKFSECDVDLVKSVTSKNTPECVLKTKDCSSNSNTDSGFDSQMSSDSQNFEERVPKTIESQSPIFHKVIDESTRRHSPRKILTKTSPPRSKCAIDPTILGDGDVEGKLVSSGKKLTSTALPSTYEQQNVNLSKSKTVQKTIDSKPEHINEETEKNSVQMNEEHWLWVEKYKPTNTKKIIGQQGDKSNVKKLTDWLSKWYKNNASSKKAVFVPNGWNKDPTGACFKAALLSGPPGVGKTTSVNLVCKELGFDMVEFNASDTRSKKLLQEEVSRLLSNTSLTPYFSSKKSAETVTKKHVLVMDEVDGMAGNEDRGGIQELIQLIKSTRIPIICMCNDRNHPKIRSLVNYCFDLRFSRPRVEQIKGYMRMVCFKEKLNIGNEALTDIITSANNDVRLVLNHLSMLAAASSNLETAKKYIKLNAWDVLRKVFAKEDHKKMSIHDKCDLFFFDYNIAPLFVQENYLAVKPWDISPSDKCKKMELFARAADCISRGDLVDANIRQNMAWSLLPTQAVFASYAPGEILEGYCGGQIQFPSWLGKNSRQNKMDRLLQEIQVHTRLKLSASKESINLDYAAHLRDKIIGPLIREGADGVKMALEALHEYQLLKDDLDSLQEICQWPNTKNAWASLDSKVKAAFTRTYNKNPPVRPYSLTAAIKKTVSNSVEDFEMDDEENDEAKSDDETDAMIITKKKTAPSVKKTENSSTSSSKKNMGQTSSAGKRGRKK